MYRDILFLITLLLLMASCKEPLPQEDQPVSFVGRVACVSCHEEQQTRWQGSHHDRALQVATSENVLGDFSGASFSYAGTTSTFFTRQDTLFVRTDGPDGVLVDYPIAYTLGVYPLQQYLIAFPDGRLQTLGIAWDSRPPEDGGGRWFHLYPDEAVTASHPLHWTSLHQNANHLCVDCHTTNLRKGFLPEEDRFETSWTDPGITCEACHGPGSRHVAWAKARAENQEVDADDNGLLIHLIKRAEGAWSIDPETGNARPNPLRQTAIETDLCARCHARRTALQDPQKPGGALMDTFLPTLLEENLYYPDGQVQGEVYEYGSFLQSKMYHQGVACSDCHDPHNLTLKAPGNALCGGCHLASKYDAPSHHFHQPDSPGAQCVDCHMPSNTFMVIDPRRDHSFRIPRPDLSVKLQTPNACNQCHQDRPAEWAAEQVASWYGEGRRQEPRFGEVLFAGRQGLPGADTLLAQLAAEIQQPAIVRATALSLLQPSGSMTRSTLLEALKDPHPMLRHTALGMLEAMPPQDRLDLAYPLLSDTLLAVRLEAARMLAGASVPNLSTPQKTRLEKTLGAYLTAERIHADRPENQVNMGIFFGAQGKFAEAEAAYQTALHRDASYVAGYVNLVDLYQTLGRDAEGEKLLRQALVKNPEAAALHHALGLVLVRLGQRAEAMGYLEQAALLEPADARFQYVYGIALHSSGAVEKALAILEQALQRHPNDQDMLLGLITMHRDQGDMQKALGYAKRLQTLRPHDEGLRQLIVSLQNS